jgi:3-oxoacyl-[acyl-carrier-protein] synthase-3
MIKSVVKGIGSYLPERILSNAELSETVETSDEWIRERTGIGQRHIASDEECTSDLGLAAAKSALADAGMSADDIDLIVVASTTPDYTFPSTATIIQHKLGIKHGAAFDLQAVCSGFIYGVNVVDSLLRTGTAKNALLIGAETFSRILDWEDRTTCVLFGDGAGAMVLSAEEGGDSGVLNTFIRSNGEHRELLYVDGGPSKTQTVGHVRMIGNQVFKHAVKDISKAMEECAEGAGIPISDIDWFVPHQANQRILNGVAKRLKLDPKQVISTVEFHANTSAASVPLAMDAAVKDGRIKKGDLVMLEAFGGGFTWGAALLRY